MRKRCLAVILVLVMCMSMIPVNVFAGTTEPTIVRVLDGNITKGELWTALGCSKYAYHYCKIDEDGEKITGWKRLESASDENPAEFVENQRTYLLESINWFNDTFGGSWNSEGTFKIQYYHKIAISADELNGGAVTVNGEALQASYDVDSGSSLTLEFSAVEGYVPQVKQGSGMWTTVSGNSYMIAPKLSSSYTVRYAPVADELHAVTVAINDEALGTYTGLESDKIADGTEVQLTVTPYNEITNSANDRDAYVKSVKVNGTELTGSYSGTVFSGTFTVTEETTVEIQFAERLVLKAPTIYDQKYSGDPKIYMYSAKMNMDKKVSEQADAIETSIIESTVDKDQTAGYESVQIKVKGNLQFVGDVYMGIKDNSLDAVSDNYRDLLAAILGNNTNWGDRTFHNGDEKWEEIRLVLPASDDGRYPAVQTEELTVWIEDIRPTLKIEGTTEKATVESDENIDSAIKAAVKKQILEKNPDATLNKIGESNITYEYEKPEFASLKAETATDVSVKVKVAKSDNYLDSTGTITVPVSKASTSARVSITTDGHGEASYLVSDNKYTFTLTPEDGYYVKELQITDTPETGDPVQQTADLSKMTVYRDGAYSYNYVLDAQDNHSYVLKALFVKYEINLVTNDDKLSFYDGLYENNEQLTAAIEAKLNKTHDTFPSGTMYLEYKAGNDVWLTVGAELPDESCHKFGKNVTEVLRYRYVFENDQFAVISNEVSLNVTDGRIPTEVKLKANNFEVAYTDFINETDKTALLLNALLDGVYTVGEDAVKLEEAVVSISPDTDNFEAETLEITLTYAGDEEYMSASAKANVTLTAQAASVAVKVQPTTVVYGSEYNVEVSTVPENIQTIRVAMGINLKETSVMQELIPISLSIQGPDKLCDALKVYAGRIDTDNKITVYDVALGMEQMYLDATVLRDMGIPKASFLQSYQLVAMCANVLQDMDVMIADTLPTDVGFYVVSAIAAEQGYDDAMAVDYLTITPKNIKATLAWKNEIGNSITFEQLQKKGYMDAEVASVAEGSAEEAEEQLVTMYLGQDEKGGIAVFSESDMTVDAYTQIAFLEEWTSNVQYASVPIMREFALGADYADVQFVDAQANPTDIYFYDAGNEISAPVTVDGAFVTEGLNIAYKELTVFGDSEENEGSDLPNASGLYWLAADYQKMNDDGAVTAVGKDNALLVISKLIEGFDPRDTVVPYDGNEKFIDIIRTRDVSEVEYLSVIADSENKKLNIILPESMNELSEIIPSLGTFGDILTFLDGCSADNAQEMALLALLKQVQSDIRNITGWTVSIDSAKPKEVGKYSVYLMAFSDDVYLCKRSLEITKADPSYTAPTGKTLTYNGSDQELVNAGSTSDGTMMYSLDGEHWSETVPTGTNHSTYEVKYKVVGDKNHKDTEEKSVKVTIAQLNIADAQITLETDSMTYSGSEQTVKITSVKMGKLDVTYEIQSGNVGADVKTYTMIIVGTGNYTGTAEKEWEILKADAAYTAPTGKTLTYNGSDQELVTAGSTSDGTMMYSLDGENWSETVPTGINHDNYVVKYKVIGDANHKDTEENSVKVTIAQLDITNAQITLENAEFTYSGFEQTVSITSVKLNNLDVTYQIQEGGSGTDADSYVLKLSGTGNYTGTAQKEWKIQKADPAYTIPAGNALTYNGSDQELITAGSTSDGIMMYSLDGEHWSETVPTGIDHSTYVVKYKVVGDKNHKDTEAKSVEATIAQLDIADAQIMLEKEELTYNGLEQTVKITSVKKGELDVTYEIQTGSAGTNVEAYTLIVTGTGNYSGTAKKEWKIKKAVVTISAMNKDAYLGKEAPDLSNPILDQDYKMSGLIGTDMLEDGVEIVLNYDDSLDMNQCGRYNIVPSVTGIDSRYDFVFENGVLSVAIEPKDEVTPEPDKPGTSEPDKPDTSEPGKSDAPTDTPTNIPTGGSQDQSGSSSPRTGDAACLELWFVAVFAVCGIAAVCMNRKKKYMN